MDTPIKCLTKQMEVLIDVRNYTITNFDYILTLGKHNADSLRTCICDLIDQVESYEKAISILNENQRPEG